MVKNPPAGTRVVLKEDMAAANLEGPVSRGMGVCQTGSECFLAE